MKALLFAACALICAPAFAQAPPGAPPPPGGPEMQVEMRAEAIDRVQRAFAIIDANHDGAIDQTEAAGAGARMAAAAQAGHGGPGPAGPGGPGPAGPGGAGPRGAAPAGPGGHGIDQMLAKADANKDGRVTLQEMTDDSVVRFDMLDANHDGKLTPEERAAAPQPTQGRQ